MVELIERIKEYLTFNKEEAIGLMVSALVIGFVFAFKDWSLSNFVLAVIIALLSFLFHTTAQKYGDFL